MDVRRSAKVLLLSGRLRMVCEFGVVSVLPCCGKENMLLKTGDALDNMTL